MSQAYDILIQLRRGTEHHWTQKQDIIPFYGEMVGVYEAQKDSSGALILVPDPKVEGALIAKHGRFLYALMGDGYRPISELMLDTRLFPVAMETLDAVLAGMEGACRDFDDITNTNATTSYGSVNEMLYALHYPYGAPRFTAFTPSAYATLEVGIAYDPNRAYGWDTSNTKNVKPGSVQIDMEMGSTVTTLASGLDGKSPSGGLAVTGKPALNSGVIGQKAKFTISGRNTREQAMAPLVRTLGWEGKRCWFMHPNAEYLVQGMNSAPGEPDGTYQASDSVVGGYINAALNAADKSALGNGPFNDLVLPAGEGSRLYLFYPEAYRSTQRVIDYTTKSDYPIVKRKITITRNGVDIVGYLFGMNVLVVGNTLKVTAL